MRFIGLTLCLLASTFGARADSLEDRVTALELRVKVLEDALHAQGGAANAVASIDGTYKATMPNGTSITATFDKGKVTVVDGSETKTATYTVAGGKVFVTGDGKTESLTIDGDHLRTDDNNRIDFQKTAPATSAPAVDGSYQAILPVPGGKTVTLELANGKASSTMDIGSTPTTTTGTYEVVGDRLVVTMNGTTDTFTIEGDHLKIQKGAEKLDFQKTK